jgi:hypothetical protein
MEITKVTPELIMKHLLLEQYKKGFYSFNPVYSGFNKALVEHYGYAKGSDYTDKLKADGLIEIRGNKVVNRATGKVSKSVIIWLTEKGMEVFGIRPPTAGAKPTPDKKVDSLIADTAKRFNVD